MKDVEQAVSGLDSDGFALPHDMAGVDGPDGLEAARLELLESLPLSILVAFDRDLRCVSVRGPGFEAVRFSPAALVGRPLREVLPTQVWRQVEGPLRATLCGDVSTSQVVHESRTFAVRLAPARHEAPQGVGGLCLVQDVTRERQHERSMREAEQRLRLTFEHAPIGQAIVELDGRWRDVNLALTRLLGYDREQLLQMTFQDITHPEDLDLDLGHLARLVEGEIESYQMEKRYFRADGAVVWVLLSVALVSDEAGIPAYLVSQIEDITERKRQQQALLDLAEMLAHDLRSPATVVVGLAELLSDDLDTELERRHHAERIGAAARSMTALLDGALTAVTLETGQMQADPARVDVAAAARTAVEDLVQVPAVAVFEAKGECHAWVDPVHLQRVVANLVTNAVKYGGQQIRVRVTALDSGVELRVADDGDGVDQEFEPLLFERRTRSASARSGGQRGSGLGLHIVRTLLELNGGTVRYQVADLGGAEFVVQLVGQKETLLTHVPEPQQRLTPAHRSRS